MRKETVFTSVHLEPSDYQALKELAAKLDKTQSAVIRQALRELAQRILVTNVTTSNDSRESRTRIARKYTK